MIALAMCRGWAEVWTCLGWRLRQQPARHCVFCRGSAGRLCCDCGAPLYRWPARGV